MVKEFVKRGLLFAGLGPVALGIVYLILFYSLEEFQLSGAEVFLAILSTYVLAFVQAGASGVGLAAIQYAKLLGAKVITTVSSQEKANAVKKFGADIAVNYKTENLSEVLAANPPNIALDCVGGKLMGESLKHMSFGGRWIMIATLAGGDTLINLETTAIGES